MIDRGSAAASYGRARSGDRRALGRLLSCVERGGQQADDVTELAFGDVQGAAIIGITGAPGAGKSTLTGLLIALALRHGQTPAVLAVDPSSPLTGGAILGDRIRMDDRVQFATHEPRTNGRTQLQQPFIRSMATRGHAGGLALAVPAALRMFDVAGYDPIIVETVGIGQVEVDVAAIADTTVVVVTPGWGDSVQANKSGLLEVADVFVVNKADRAGADQAKRDLELMLDLGHITGLEDPTGYRPAIVLTTASAGSGEATGVAGLWDAIVAHREHLAQTGRLEMRRRIRLRAEVRNRVEQMVLANVAQAVPVWQDDRFAGGAPPTRLADEIYQSVLDRSSVASDKENR